MNKKWICNTLFKLKNRDHFKHEVLIDFGANVNCIPSRYFEKFDQDLQTTEGKNLKINHRIFEVQVWIEKLYIKISFLLVKSLKQGVILGNPFLAYLKPFTATEKRIIIQDKSCYNFEKLPKYVQKIFCNTRPKPQNKRRINNLNISSDFYYQSKF